MKKLISLLTIVATLSASASAFANVTVDVDNTPVLFDAAPRILYNRTMVPVRAIFEKLGATVNWDPALRTATAQKDGKEIALTIGSNTLRVNDRYIVMDTSAMILENRTFVPARFCAEAMDSTVGWDAATRKVSIDSTKKPDIQYYKRFSNQKMAIMYPEDWYVDTSFGDMVFIDNQSSKSSAKGMGIIMISDIDYGDMTFEELVKSKHEFLTEDSSLQVLENYPTTVNGCPANYMKYKDTEGDSVDLYIIAGKTGAFFVEFVSDKDSAFKDVYTSVLSTLMFL